LFRARADIINITDFISLPLVEASTQLTKEASMHRPSPFVLCVELVGDRFLRRMVRNIVVRVKICLLNGAL
jgi:hypothetical protein